MRAAEKGMCRVLPAGSQLVRERPKDEQPDEEAGKRHPHGIKKCTYLMKFPRDLAPSLRPHLIFVARGARFPARTRLLKRIRETVSSHTLEKGGPRVGRF